MKDEVRALREELSDLKAGATGLSEQVSLLSNALATLNDLQVRQAQQEQVIEHVAKVVVPREEHERKDAQEQLERQHYRRALRRRIASGSVVLVGVVAASGMFLGAYINGKADESYRVCQQQNVRVAAQRDYLQAVAATSTNPVLRDAASKALTSYQNSNCEALR